jgi:hypothetical protein
VLIAAGRARQHHQQCKGQHKERDHRSGSDGFSEYLLTRVACHDTPDTNQAWGLKKRLSSVDFPATPVWWSGRGLGSAVGQLVGWAKGFCCVFELEKKSTEREQPYLYLFLCGLFLISHVLNDRSFRRF